MKPGELYIPSNGTEGDGFLSYYCDQCLHEKYSHTMQDGDLECGILIEALIGEQPKEWQYDVNGEPACTAWEKWDWGNDDDGWNEPPGPEPYDPNQLLLPFDITELFGFDDPEIIVTKRAILEVQSI
jgi:hypothetical protein